MRLGLFRSLNTSQLERFLLPDGAHTTESRRVITNRVLGSLRKRGLVAPAAARYVGELKVLDIGFPKQLLK